MINPITVKHFKDTARQVVVPTARTQSLNLSRGIGIPSKSPRPKNKL